MLETALKRFSSCLSADGVAEIPATFCKLDSREDPFISGPTGLISGTATLVSFFAVESVTSSPFGYWIVEFATSSVTSFFGFWIDGVNSLTRDIGAS